MRAERAVVRFLGTANDIWHAHFPRLHRRAQWHIVIDLCTRGRDGASVGELYGLVKQVFLLDDATVKDRINEIASLGLCTLDPSDGRIAARTVVVPSDALLQQFDRHLQALAAALREVVADIESVPIPPKGIAEGVLTAEQRSLVLQALAVCSDAWLAALERVFEASRLSKARRLEAKRNLISTSHRALLHMAVAQHYGLPPHSDGEEGILADQMAAALLQLTGQNFQTTRDHIAYLIELSLLERRRGRSLHVALAPAAAAELQIALQAASAALPTLLRNFDAVVPGSHPPDLTRHVNLDEATMLSPPPPDAPIDPWLRELVVVAPATDRRRFIVTQEPLTIGRQPPSDILLTSNEISRAHCRVRVEGEFLSITDLLSTNGTFVDGARIKGTTTMRPGGQLAIGSYVLTYERVGRTQTRFNHSVSRSA
jgi:hypothetical protein